MILRGSYTTESFISGIACTIGGSERCATTAGYLTRDRIDRGDGLIYFAGGYWRGRPVWADRDVLVGVELVNPDRTRPQIRTVEQGIALLKGYEYVERKTDRDA